MTKIERIQKAAFEKFGTPLEVIWKDEAKHADFFFVAIKRDSHPFPDAPYMTITASISSTDWSSETDSNYGVNFFWGHYDLTLGQLAKAVAEAKLNAIAA